MEIAGQLLTASNPPMDLLSHDVPILIPAYQPGTALHGVVDALLTLGDPAIIVVNDGSSPESAPIFETLQRSGRVHVLHHAVNLGKGAALKTGLNYALVHFPGCVGVVTADADGQHDAHDILRIANRLRTIPDALILGVREFNHDVPFRSRIGNNMTRLLMRLLVGQNLSDTQTGLRGIPRRIIGHLLRMSASGYEFELDMLIACKHQMCTVAEETIRTIYLEGNKSSHFHPLFDSMRIYVLLFRFSVLSLFTAVLDNIVFMLTFGATLSVAEAQIAGRITAMLFNYAGARRAVFHSRQKHVVVLPKYVLLVTANGLLSYVLIRYLSGAFGFSVITAKLLVEGILFIANFAIQRDFVFTRRRSPRTATDWDAYYTTVPATAELTRKYTNRVLVETIRRYAKPAENAGLSIVEIGGANSCFMDSILAAVGPSSYDVVDTNQYGLTLLARRMGNSSIVRLHRQSVLDLSLDSKADVVFSVGLVEHFNRDETQKAVLAHFDALRAGGLAILTFPTPTFLYRITRKLIEILGMWRFPDERPLDPAEVIEAVRQRGEVLYQRTLWPLMLTQHLIVARHRPAASQGAIRA